MLVYQRVGFSLAEIHIRKDSFLGCNNSRFKKQPFERETPSRNHLLFLKSKCTPADALKFHTAKKAAKNAAFEGFHKWEERGFEDVVNLCKPNHCSTQ
jgi:hypothetical protein